MPAYVIGNVKTIVDPVAMGEYRARVLDTMRPYGGRFAVRGGEVDVLEGAWLPAHLSLLEFPSPEHVRVWYASPEYQAIKHLRDGTEMELVVVHGAGDPP